MFTSYVISFVSMMFQIRSLGIDASSFVVSTFSLTIFSVALDTGDVEAMLVISSSVLS